MAHHRSRSDAYLANRLRYHIWLQNGSLRVSGRLLFGHFCFKLDRIIFRLPTHSNENGGRFPCWNRVARHAFLVTVGIWNFGASIALCCPFCQTSFELLGFQCGAKWLFNFSMLQTSNLIDAINYKLFWYLNRRWWLITSLWSKMQNGRRCLCLYVCRTSDLFINRLKHWLIKRTDKSRNQIFGIREFLSLATPIVASN